MNQKLQESLAEVIKALTEAAQQVGAVAQEQLPILVREVLIWGFYSAAYYVVIGLVLIIPFALIGLVFRATQKGWDEGSEPALAVRIVYSVVAVMLTIPGIIMILGGIRTMIMIKVAPRVYLLEQVRELVQ